MPFGAFGPAPPSVRAEWRIDRAALSGDAGWSCCRRSIIEFVLVVAYGQTDGVTMLSSVSCMSHKHTLINTVSVCLCVCVCVFPLSLACIWYISPLITDMQSDKTPRTNPDTRTHTHTHTDTQTCYKTQTQIVFPCVLWYFTPTPTPRE